mmetsp:Transcript_12261/g.31068  ORF Transcript_12261/g.31068 Transcript_12261/m.31068 type:complete len:243 (+) Transcript_12261:392-1120(+)
MSSTRGLVNCLGRPARFLVLAPEGAPGGLGPLEEIQVSPPGAVVHHPGVPRASALPQPPQHLDVAVASCHPARMDVPGAFHCVPEPLQHPKSAPLGRPPEHLSVAGALLGVEVLEDAPVAPLGCHCEARRAKRHAPVLSQPTERRQIATLASTSAHRFCVIAIFWVEKGPKTRLPAVTHAPLERLQARAGGGIPDEVHVWLEVLFRSNRRAQRGRVRDHPHQQILMTSACRVPVGPVAECRT